MNEWNNRKVDKWMDGKSGKSSVRLLGIEGCRQLEMVWVQNKMVLLTV